MNQDEAFIGAVLAAPRDDSPRLAYAGWLNQRGDARGHYLRTEMQWAQAREAKLEAQLKQLATNLDAVWMARVSRPPVGVCADHLRLREPVGEIRPKLTAADLDWVERRFHVTLPADYRGFLLNYNGGVCADPRHYRIPGRAYGDWEYEILLGLGSVWAAAESEIDWYEFDLVWNLQALEELRSNKKEPSKFPAQQKVDEETAERWRGEPHGHLMVIGFGPPSGELELVGLGCGGEVIGQVYLVSVPWATECEQSCLVAPTFAAFLAMLTDFDPDHVKAIKTGDVAALRRWLDAGGDPNERYHGRPLMSHGQDNARPESVRELLAHGAQLSGALLMDAGRNSGCQGLIDVLRSHWVLSARDADDGNSPEVPPVIRAIKSGNLPALRGWLDAGGDPNEVYQQLSLLAHAVVHGNVEAARELLARKARVWDGLLPYGKSSGSQELVDLLQVPRK
jgi:uncharacterized protein (TIGR02996 family)